VGRAQVGCGSCGMGFGGGGPAAPGMLIRFEPSTPTMWFRYVVTAVISPGL